MGPRCYCGRARRSTAGVLFLAMSHLAEVIHQQKNEHIVLELRRHWATFLPTIFLFIALALVPLAVYFFLTESFDIRHDLFWYPAAMLFGSAYYLFILVFFFAQFIDYHLDMWVVTNERIIDINQKGLFSRIVTEMHLVLIQDVTSESHGFFAHMFNYGDLHIHSSGPVQRVEFLNIPRPHEVRNALIQLTAEDKRKHKAHDI